MIKKLALLGFVAWFAGGLAGWTFLVTNFFGLALDQVTFSAPGNNTVPVFSTTTKKWSAGTITANDSRLPTPSTIGKVIVDTGVAFGETAQGAANTLLHGTGASTPTFSPLVDADITALTITAGSLAATVTNRLMLTPATVGRIEVDGGAGNPPVALAQGAAGTIFISQGAAANPAMTAMSGDATISAGGVVTLANTAVSANSYGDSTHVATFTVDSKGRLTAAGTAAIAGVSDASSTVKGVTKLSIDPVSATNPVALALNDTRVPATPTTIGALVVDNGAGLGETAQGAANTLLHGTGATTPTFSKLVDADVTAATLTAASMAAAVTNRLMLTPATVGSIEVDGGSGAVPVRLAQGAVGAILLSAGATANPVFTAQGAAGTIFISQGATSNPVATALSGDITMTSGGVVTIGSLKVVTGNIAANAVTAAKVGSDVIVTAGTNAFTGDQDHGNNRVTGVKELRFTGQAGDPASFAVGGLSYDTTKKTFRAKGDMAAGSTEVSLIEYNADSTAVTTSGTDTAFSGSTFTIPANTLTVGKRIRVHLFGHYNSGGTGTKTLKVRIGGTAVIQLGAVTPLNNSNAAWSVDCLLTCRSTGASGSVQGGASMTYATQNTGAATTIMATNTAATIDTTANKDLDVTWNWSSASQSATLESAEYLEY